ncbi:UvrB2 [Desulforapulum autotrophicum HRM2]|uniref:UvrB2 n=1 Tax=Desulforapulum autotrophicum (strain ATCC 43914 / DSM 3382 / VKM B-1955 / HRM2) TaxID=177437 RepID=C0QHY2_DESAH|nr:UvrB2 [Desulforapulum autotrophicum HRM2]
MSPYGPAGDHPKAIDYLVRGVKADEKYQVLLGVTRSG